MNFLKNWDWQAPTTWLKAALVGVGGLFGIALIAAVALAALQVVMPTTMWKSTVTSGNGFAPAVEEAHYGGGSMAYDAADDVALSMRNVATSPGMPVPNPTVTGDDAEEFEVTEYHAQIETRSLGSACGTIMALKAREDVIFENATEGEHNCYYRFKVKEGSVEEILSIIEAMDPDELDENTYTIKEIVNDYTSEIEILENKLAAIEKTLTDAVAAYDEITELATNSQDAASLAKIIDSKVDIIERLTQERININARLERLERSKAEQLDRLGYTYFNVSIAENKFVDFETISDSWKQAVQNFVRDFNNIIQNITINLITLFFLIIQYVIYLLIILFVAKYGWRAAKRLWQR